MSIGRHAFRLARDRPSRAGRTREDDQVVELGLHGAGGLSRGSHRRGRAAHRAALGSSPQLGLERRDQVVGRSHQGSASGGRLRSWRVACRRAIEQPGPEDRRVKTSVLRKRLQYWAVDLRGRRCCMGEALGRRHATGCAVAPQNRCGEGGGAMQCAPAVGSGSLLGCRRAGSDDIRYSLVCPVVQHIATLFFLCEDWWPASSSLRQALFLDAAAADDRNIVLRALWHDAVCCAVICSRAS